MLPAAGRVKILVVEDDPFIVELLETYLTVEGYWVEVAGNGDAMRRLMEKSPADLVIMDLMLPGEDGFALTRFVRERYGCGVIILTTRKGIVDRIVGLEVGADDYVFKPFEPRELLARIRSLLRRLGPIAAVAAAEAAGTSSGAPSLALPAAEGDTRQVVRFDRWTLDLDQHRLYSSDGTESPLTASEFNILSEFVSKPGRVLSRDHLLAVVHHREWDPGDRSIDVLITRVRRKLEGGARTQHIIRTVRGAGYLFAADVTREVVPSSSLPPLRSPP